VLSSLLALPGVLVKDVTEFVPPGFRDQNRILEIPLHLRDGDVTPLGVLLAREEEVLVLDLDVAGLRRLRGLFDFAVVVLVDQFPQLNIELLHAVGRDEDLEPVVSSGECLRDLEEPSPSVLLQVDVVLLVVFEHDLRPKLALGQALRVNAFQLTIELDHAHQVVSECCGRWQCHQDLVFSSVRRNLSHLDEATAGVLLHVQIEPFVFQDKGPGRQVSPVSGSTAAATTASTGSAPLVVVVF